jgi:hypothetical protein
MEQITLEPCMLVCFIVQYSPYDLVKKIIKIVIFYFLMFIYSTIVWKNEVLSVDFKRVKLYPITSHDLESNIHMQ